MSCDERNFLTGNEAVREVGKLVGLEQDWIGELEYWMGSSKADSIADAAEFLLGNSVVQLMRL